MNIRIGNGIDYHQLQEGLPLWIGGVQIPHTKGALGHSDADVLLHTICDALLGALSLGDIGQHFPDTDAAYAGIDSKVLLRRCHNLIREKGYWIVNIDSTICLQEPKLRPYIEGIRRSIAQVLGMDMQDISVKATTTEHMGFVGRGEGIMCFATVLLSKF